MGKQGKSGKSSGRNVSGAGRRPPEHYFYLALELEEQGKFREAVENYRRLLEIRPDEQGAHNNLGNLQRKLGQLDAAAASYRRALEIKPDCAMTHANLGNALKDLGQFEAATASYRNSLEIKPDYVAAQINLGNVLRDRGLLDEAVASYRQALKIHPDFAVTHNNLCDILRVLGQYDEAAANCRRALELNPEFAEAHANLANIYKELDKSDEAIASFRQALRIKPDYGVAHANLGNLMLSLGRLPEAATSFRRSLEVSPGAPDVHSNLLFALNYHAGKHEDEIRAACREYDLRFNRWDGAPHPNERIPQKRLRIGYVSPDFRRHAVAYFAEPILTQHDRTRVEVFCYAEVQREDDYTEHFRGLSDHWRSTVGLSDAEVERRIREDRIDILVDLAGHTRGNRLPVFGRKPAPLQITYLGFAGSTGLTTMDYRLTDFYADPEGDADNLYTEKLRRLPDSLWCYRPSTDMPETTPLPALARGCLTFGSFNNFSKIDRDTVELWAGLLRSIPDARLMILTVPEGEARARLLNDFAELGIGAQRLELHGAMPMEAFHRRFLEADIALDPVNVNGGTTTCEALWMGLPVISLTGKHFLSRAGLSILSTVGMADFAAATPEDYIHIASYLDGNRELLAELRAGLRGHVAGSPLSDEVGFTRNLENIYREVWRKWCSAS